VPGAAQTSPVRPAFDVASIRPVASCTSPQEVQTSPGSLIVRGRTLGVLVQWAYELPHFRINGPAWLRDNCFDLVAKSAAGGDDAQLRLMLRTLLADRFGMTVHFEQQEMPVYSLTLAKGGPKFHESTTEGPPVIDRGNQAILNAHHMTMTDVGDRIADELGRPVTDATGLTGRYEIRLDLSPYMAAAGTAEAGKLDMMSILFTGLQEQLGLRLEARKATVSILVIDHAEKSPTEN
jgi:uncharacterized protein (TIGR03435 family)